MKRSTKVFNFLKYLRPVFCSLIIMAFWFVLFGCAVSGRQIKTESLKGSEISGVFTLILYGGNYGDDLETVAFLDKEGDAYSFDIYAPDFNYRVIKGVSAHEGLTKAKVFVSGNSSVYQVKMSSIIDDKSGTIGYEVRPLYYPFTYGIDDVLDVWYAVKQDKIVVTIKLKPSVEYSRMRDDFRSE